MKRIILAALLLSVGISLLGAAPKRPVFVGTFPGAEVGGLSMVGGLGAGGWRTVMVAISADGDYLEADSLKVNGGAYDYIINTDNSPGEFVAGMIHMTNQNQTVQSPVVDYITLAGTSYWSGSLTGISFTYMPLDDLPGFLFEDTEILSAEYTMFWRTAGYTLAAGDTILVVGGTEPDLPWMDSGNYNSSNNYMNHTGTVQWPTRNSSTDPINWHPVGLNAVSDLAYTDHPYLVDYTTTGLNDPSVFDVSPWVQTVADGGFNGGLWYLGSRAIEGGSVNFRAGSNTSSDGAQERPRLIIEYKYRYFEQPRLTDTASYPLGGHTWSSAIGHNEQYWALGGDVSATWTSIDGGLTWDSNNEGVPNDQDQPVHYTRDIIPVKNDYFEGFIMANDSGIWEKNIPFAKYQSWTRMFDETDNNYLSYTYYNWGDWLEVIGFGSLSWDGNNLLAATAGHNRYQNNAYESYYPWNVADGDSLTGDIMPPATWADGDWSDNAFGKAGLWLYDYTNPTHGWHPVEGKYDSYVQAYGRYKDVSVAVVGSDTLYAVATSAGPKLLTVTSTAKTWTNIDTYNWYNVSEAQVDNPLFTWNVSYTTEYHYAGASGASSIGDGHVTLVEDIQESTPASGTVTVDGNGYAYTSWEGKTFDISGTLSTEVDKGDIVSEPLDTQSTWSIKVTGRGDIYCVVTNGNQLWDGDSGLYVLRYGEITWEWVGDGTGLIPVAGGTPGSETDLLSVADVGNGAWEDTPLSPAYAYDSATANRFGDYFVRVSGNEGSGSDPDTLYLGGNHSVTTYRALVGYGAGGPAGTTWENIIRRDYTTDPPSEYPMPDLTSHSGMILSSANFLIHEVAVDPENSDLIFVTPSDQMWFSENGGTNWTNNAYLNSTTDADFTRATGVDEICVNGIAVLSDGRLITSRGDVFAGITESDTWEYSTPFRPLGVEAFEDCSTENTDDALWGTESGDVIVTQGWDGNNLDEDYIIFTSGDIIQSLAPGKIFMVHDDNDDGDFFDAGEWDNITSNLPSANKYLFPGNHVTNGTDKIWVCFKRFNKVLCESTSSVAQHGVLELTYSDPNWSYAILDTTSTVPTTVDFQPTKLQYDSDENRLWAAVKFQGDTGGVYMIDLDGGDWLAVMGEGAEAPYATPYGVFGAFESIRMSDDNKVLYVGSTGRSGKQGGIWKCSNLDAVGDAGDPFVFDMVLNTAGKAYAPTVATSRFYDSRGHTTAAGLSGNRLMCIDIMIDPYSNDKIWFLNGSNFNRMNSLSGLFALDTVRNEVVEVFPDDPRSSFTEPRAGIGLVYTDAVYPPRILWGTHCVGVSFFEYNGKFPTE